MALRRFDEHHRLENEELSSLWHACATNDTSTLIGLIETLKPTLVDLLPGLVTAMSEGFLVMARYLLELGVEINSSIVNKALRVKSIPLLDLLREFGWDVNTRVEAGSGMPLAFVAGDTLLVAYLLSRGADPNLGPRIGPGIGHTGRFQIVSTSGWTLHAAARSGNVDSFDMLLAHGALLQNAAAVHAAVQGGSVEMVEHVLDLGANVNERDGLETMGFYFCGTPLLRAINMGRVDLARILLGHGADATVKGRECLSALDLVKSDDVTVEMRELIENAAKDREREHSDL